jgi:hypothetical protein
VIGEPETFSSAMIVSSVTWTSLWRMISNVIGSSPVCGASIVAVTSVLLSYASE